METLEVSDVDQVTKETAENGNSCENSEIMISQKGEEEEHNAKTEDNQSAEEIESTIETEYISAEERLEASIETEGENADKDVESPIKTEDNNKSEKLESLIKNNDNNTDINVEHQTQIYPSKEDKVPTPPFKKHFVRTIHSKDNISSEIKVDSKDAGKSRTTKGQNTSGKNNLAMIEFVKNEDGTNSPEIVVEPKFAERLPSAKITSQIMQVVTPINGAVPKLPKASTKHKCLKKLKQCFLLILFSISVVGYAVGGAYLFSHLESKRDVEHNAKVDKWKNDTAILLATELRQVKPHEEIWARKVFYYLEVYEQDLLKASALGYRRQDYQNRPERWSWTSSLFFSVSLMTSSGYGPMTPRSKLGRATAMLYSLCGIPLAFSWFMVIGYILATKWLSFFQNVCCHLCRKKITNSQSVMLSKDNQSKPPKLTKLRSNSILPIEEQKLMSQYWHQDKNSKKFCQKIFPGELHGKLSQNNPLETRLINIMHHTEFTELKDNSFTIDYVVSIIYALLFFVIYCVFSSIFFSVRENWILTDVLYISFLMYLTLGPGCHELDNDGIEIEMKNNIFYTIHLCIGYCILAMVVNLIRLMIHRMRKTKKLQKPISF